MARIPDDRDPSTLLTSTNEGGAPVPPEFAGSTAVVTTTQTGIPIGQDPIIPNYSTLIHSQLDQDKTEERKQTLVNANFFGLNLTQRETDPISGVPIDVTKTIVPSIGGVYAIGSLVGGSGYSPETTVTGTTPFGGLPAIYTPVIVARVITAITISDPGSGRVVNDTLSIVDSGGGSGASGVGLIPTYPSVGAIVASITSLVGGSAYTVATVATVPAPPYGGRTAILGVTIVAGVIAALPIIDPGFGYESAPTITITDSGGGTGASATAVLGIDTWYDYTPLDKWRSIQFASRCPATQAQLDALAVTIPGTTDFPWPETLNAVTIYRAQGTHVETATGTFTQVTIGGGYQFSGGVGISYVPVVRSESVSSLHRTYWKGMPTITDAITAIKLSQGMVVVQGGASSEFTTYSVSSIAAGTSDDINTSTQHSVVSVPPCLTNSAAISYNGSGQATGFLAIQPSTPLAFVTNDVVTVKIVVTQLNFNVYKMEVLKVTHP